MAGARPVAVLDACVLIPRGLRDLLLSCADVGVFRPVWQDEIERELHKNGVRLAIRRGDSPEEAAAALDWALERMNAAFPDARLSGKLWQPLVGMMINDERDRHVLAAAVGARASHVVTENLRDFPVRSRPDGVSVVRPDAFLLAQLERDPAAVLAGVEAMARRHQHPSHTSDEIARLLAGGVHVQRFGAELLKRIAN